jgi:hypothetical protein
VKIIEKASKEAKAPKRHFQTFVLRFFCANLTRRKYFTVAHLIKGSLFLRDPAGPVFKT